MSPTQRSLAYLRERYPLVQKVEYWDHYAYKRRDLFGIIDIVAVNDHDIIGVQATSASNVSARIHKITDSVALPILRKAGISVKVHGWSKSRKTGKWVLREVDLS